MSGQIDTEQIVETYADMVYRLAFARVGDKNDADDVFQEVFLRYFKNKPCFTSEEHCRAWLIRVTINCSKNLWKSAWRRKTQQLSEDMLFSDPADQELFDELLKLPDWDRTVLHLFYYEEMSVEQISRISGKKPATIRTQLTRARRKLKILLEEEQDV